MKNRLIMIMLAICLGIAGYTNVEVSEESETRNPFERVYQDNHVVIYVDTETNVMYVTKNNGYGGTTFTIMVDQDGNPRLYEENEHDGE